MASHEETSRKREDVLQKHQEALRDLRTRKEVHTEYCIKEHGIDYLGQHNCDRNVFLRALLKAIFHDVPWYFVGSEFNDHGTYCCSIDLYGKEHILCIEPTGCWINGEYARGCDSYPLTMLTFWLCAYYHWDRYSEDESVLSYYFEIISKTFFNYMKMLNFIDKADIKKIRFMRPLEQLNHIARAMDLEGKCIVCRHPTGLIPVVGGGMMSRRCDCRLNSEPELAMVYLSLVREGWEGDETEGSNESVDFWSGDVLTLKKSGTDFIWVVRAQFATVLSNYLHKN